MHRTLEYKYGFYTEDEAFYLVAIYNWSREDGFDSGYLKILEVLSPASSGCTLHKGDEFNVSRAHSCMAYALWDLWDINDVCIPLSESIVKGYRGACMNGEYDR